MIIVMLLVLYMQQRIGFRTEIIYHVIEFPQLPCNLGNDNYLADEFYSVLSYLPRLAYQTHQTVLFIIDWFKC